MDRGMMAGVATPRFVVAPESALLDEVVRIHLQLPTPNSQLPGLILLRVLRVLRVLREYDRACVRPVTSS